MAATTYKCPSCGAYLAFDPETQGWKCDFCGSLFTQDDILGKEADVQKEPEAMQASADDAHQVVYRCQSCGSEIMTDETTVATNCYYCHSPVVLQGKLTSDMRPDGVLPFTVDQQKAVDTFMNWVKNKRFVPKAFFKQSQVENMSGVYYPHFVSECEVEGTLQGEGRNTQVLHSPNYITTKTDHYRVRREADITFHSIMRPALSKANRKLSDGIHPFPLESEKPFSDAYLTGFLAERRDIGADSIKAGIEQEVGGYVKPLLTNTVHYESQTLTAASRIKKIKTRYVLLPTWVLTYPNSKDKDDPYYYAMNGCTGEVCGKLPIDRKKLYLTALGVGAAVFAVGCILSYLLF